jgi:hypothetical protein
MKLNSYFKNEKLAKIIMSVLLFLIIMLVAGMFVVKAEDNKTIDEPVFTERGWPKILDDNKWTTQLIFDTVQACYQGTIRWVVLSHPTLLNQIPTLAAQRQMMEHCFCVMDKIRKENKVKEYRKKVLDPEWGGNLFMLKAMECVGEYKTLPSFFMKMPTPDNETKKENKIIIKPEEPQDLQEESPDQPKEESEGSPQTIFQG